MSLTQMFAEAGWLARGVIILLVILSVYSLAVMIEKFMTYHKAKKQSIEFLPILVDCLKKNNLQGAVDKSKEFGKSHIARVVSAGLLEFLNQKSDVAASFDVVGAVTRACERETAITSAEMKKGLGGLATIGSTSPFIGLFGTVFGIINAFTGISMTGSGGLAAVSAGIAEALITTGAGIGVAIPAVACFNYFSNRLERYQVEMSNSSAELIDFFLKRHGASYGATAR
jgi:biopolymer transport protein ExbB/biopolymer transport protein TolQ